MHAQTEQRLDSAFATPHALDSFQLLKRPRRLCNSESIYYFASVRARLIPSRPAMANNYDALVNAESF